MPKFTFADMAARYVNLDKRPDRNERMIAELNRVGIAAERVRGLLPIEVNVPPAKVEVMRKRTPGAIGCHYAQRSIIAEAAKTKRNTLVMEDDLVFCDDMATRFNHIERFLEHRPWDIFWLGATFHCNPAVWHKDTLGRDIELTEDPWIVKTYGIWSTYAYIVNGDSAEKIVGLLDEIVHTSMGIDWAMIQLQPQLQTFCYVPGCVKQYDNRSNIGNGVTHFSGFAKLGPYWFQEQAEQFNPIAYNWAEADVARKN